jgi:hypothetical protein
MSKDKPRRETKKPKKTKSPKLPVSNATPTPLIKPITPTTP